MKKGLTLLLTTHYSNALVVSSRLEAYGIPCYIRNINQIQPEVGEGVEVWVIEENISKAATFLKEFNLYGAELKQLSADKNLLSNQILVPVNFMDYSLTACYWAIDLANRFHSRIKIVYTYYVPESRPLIIDDTDLITGSLYSALTELKTDGEHRMQELSKKLNTYMKANHIDVAIETAIINGVVDDITLFLAEKEKTSLIIWGVPNEKTRPYDVASEYGFKIVDRSKVPVLIVPEESRSSDIKQLKTILYATNFDESDFSSIEKLIQISQKNGMNIQCLHVSDQMSELDKVKMEQLHHYVKKVNNLVHFKFDVIVSDNVMKAFDDYIEQHKINAIAVTSHKHNLLSRILHKGTTKKLMYQTQVPLFVFH